MWLPTGLYGCTGLFLVCQLMAAQSTRQADDGRSRRGATDLDDIRLTLFNLQQSLQEERALRRVLGRETKAALEAMGAQLLEQTTLTQRVEAQLSEYNTWKNRETNFLTKYESWFRDVKGQLKEFQAVLSQFPDIEQRVGSLSGECSNIKDNMDTLADKFQALNQTLNECQNCQASDTVLEPPPATTTKAPKVECPAGLSGQNCDVIMRDCQDIQDHHADAASGIYQVYVAGTLTSVYCDMVTDGGGWLVIQKRYDGSMDFDRGYEDYETGFGDVEKEFWLGNQLIHQLTHTGQTKVRMEIGLWNNETLFAQYADFSLGGSDSSYRLHIGGYSGTAGDSMTTYFTSNNTRFSARDMGDDRNQHSSCPTTTRRGGWWYGRFCGLSNLNGNYYAEGHGEGCLGVIWYSYDNSCQSHRATEIKIRRN